MERRHKKRLATCNSCTHFKEAARGNWVGYTPLCTNCPTQIGPNEYLEDSEKTVTWVFNCTEALFCPNYEKADNYIERVRKGVDLCRNGGPVCAWDEIYSDKEFYKTEYGRKMLRANLGLPEEPVEENTKESFVKKLDAKKKEDLRTITYLRYQVKHGVSLEDALKNLGYKKKETSK